MKRCLIKVDATYARQIPAKKHISSTSRKEDKKLKRRILMSPQSIRVYFNNPMISSTTHTDIERDITKTYLGIITAAEILETRIRNIKTALSNYASFEA
ncbi:hypothetical protein Glove_493g19 [Diversispora epigaea]|uniref:Uncharacterized protein n=1 Tax=Diversispora epigaea TaxID=1348612 RepID=A0A397GKF0_9GLOM|nr:hypothetical protein Glove_493g19 [Diversispora epigaea]